MKKILTIAILLCSATLSFAQTNFGKKSKFLEGTLNYSKMNNVSSSSVNLSGGYFVTDRFALGVSGEVSDNKSSAGVFGRCLFIEKGHVSVFSQLNLVKSAETTNNTTVKANNMNIGVGLNYFVTNRLALTTQLCSLMDVTYKTGYAQPDINFGLSGVDNPFSAARLGVLVKL